MAYLDQMLCDSYHVVKGVFLIQKFALEVPAPLELSLSTPISLILEKQETVLKGEILS